MFIVMRYSESHSYYKESKRMSYIEKISKNVNNFGKTRQKNVTKIQKYELAKITQRPPPHNQTIQYFQAPETKPLALGPASG